MAEPVNNNRPGTGDVGGAGTPPPLAERLPEPAPIRPLPRPTPLSPPARRPKASIEQEKQGEFHLRQANLLRMRGELKQSLAELVKAIDANPFDPTPHSMSADILRNVGRPDDAVREYEKAIELSPIGAARTAIEAKLARLVIEQAELNSATAVAPGTSATPMDTGRLSTVIASAIVPGLGQWIAGSRVKAAIFFGLTIASVVLFSCVHGSKSSVSQGLQPMLVVSCALGGAAWLAAVIDAYLDTKRRA